MKVLPRQPMLGQHCQIRVLKLILVVILILVLIFMIVLCTMALTCSYSAACRGTKPAGCISHQVKAKTCSHMTLRLLRLLRLTEAC